MENKIRCNGCGALYCTPPCQAYSQYQNYTQGRDMLLKNRPCYCSTLADPSVVCELVTALKEISSELNKHGGWIRTVTEINKLLLRVQGKGK